MANYSKQIFMREELYYIDTYLVYIVYIDIYLYLVFIVIGGICAIVEVVALGLFTICAG